MTKYLIQFPSSAMVLSPDEFEAAGRDSHAVVRDMKQAGVYVFGGGINEAVPPVRVAGDGSVTEGAYPANGELNGGYCVIEAPDRAAALEWAARIAASCRCEQNLLEFMYDPES